MPAVVAYGSVSGRAYLVLEALPLGGRGDAARLGRQLAQQHQVATARFGGARDNWIGSTPQPNGWLDDWIAFWRERRLGHLQHAGCRRRRARRAHEPCSTTRR